MPQTSEIEWEKLILVSKISIDIKIAFLHDAYHSKNTIINQLTIQHLTIILKMILIYAQFVGVLGFILFYHFTLWFNTMLYSPMFSPVFWVYNWWFTSLKRAEFKVCFSFFSFYGSSLRLKLELLYIKNEQKW